VRGPRREALSRGYNLVLRTALRVGFSDARCGFKAVRADVARALLPHARDEEWFLNTELLVLAERGGLRIHEVPAAERDPGPQLVQQLFRFAGDHAVGLVAFGVGLLITSGALRGLHAVDPGAGRRRSRLRPAC
jgi:hypothetical protein